METGRKVFRFLSGMKKYKKLFVGHIKSNGESSVRKLGFEECVSWSMRLCSLAASVLCIMTLPPFFAREPILFFSSEYFVN